MTETSASLLERLRQRPAPASWQRLVELYTPLIRGWLRRHNVRPEDAEGGSDFAGMLDQLEDPQSALSAVWDRELR